MIHYGSALCNIEICDEAKINIEQYINYVQKKQNGVDKFIYIQSRIHNVRNHNGIIAWSRNSSIGEQWYHVVSAWSRLGTT